MLQTAVVSCQVHNQASQGRKERKKDVSLRHLQPKFCFSKCWKSMPNIIYNFMTKQTQQHTYSKFICKCEEMINVMSDMVVLQVIHKMCSISLHLFIACYSTENNFCKALSHECSEANTSNGTTVFNKGQSFVFPVTITSKIIKRV